MERSNLKYHESQVAGFASETGYVGFLTHNQQITLKEFSNRVRSASPPSRINKDMWDLELKGAQGEDGWDLFLCRWLRAREYDIEKAFQMLYEHIEWRVTEGVSKLREMTESEVLGCDRNKVLTMCPHWIGGFDSLKRPYVFHQYATLNTATLLEYTTLNHLFRHHIWVQENLSRIVALQGKKNGFVVECWCTVLDLKGMGMRTVTSAFMEMVKAFSAIDQNHYPERNGGVYILNTPSAFPFVWRGVKALMNPRTTSKINIYASSKVFSPVLVDLLGESSLLEEYGGSLQLTHNASNGSNGSITTQGTAPTLQALKNNQKTVSGHLTISTTTHTMTVSAHEGGGGEPISGGSLSSGGGGGWRNVRRRKKKKAGGKSKGAAASSESGSESMASSLRSRSMYSVKSRSILSEKGSSTKSSSHDSRSKYSVSSYKGSATKTFSIASDAFESCVPSMMESHSKHEEMFEDGKDHALKKRRRRRLMLKRRRSKGTRQRMGSSTVDFALRIAARCFLKLPGTSSLLAKDLASLCRAHYILNAFAVVLALITTAVGVYWMEKMILWTSELIQAVMWSSLLLVVLGALEMTFSFMGISAVQTRSVGVIVFVISMELSEMVAHLTLAVSSVIFFANRGPFRKAVTAVSGDASRGKAMAQDLNFYCAQLLIVSLLSTVMIMFQILIGLLVFRKLKQESSHRHRRRRHRRQGGGGARKDLNKSNLSPTTQQATNGDNDVESESKFHDVEMGEAKHEGGNSAKSAALKALNATGYEDDDDETEKRDDREEHEGSLAGSDASSAGSVDGTTEAELRKVLEVSNHITILFALMSIILGGVLLGQGILLIDVISTVAVSPFVMVLFGVFLTLAGLLGAYVSNSTQITVLVFYEIFTIINSAFLLIWAAFCFYQMTRVDALVEKNWSKLEENYDDDHEEGSIEQKERADTVSALFKSWLLVTGILETILAFFQTVNFLAARALFQLLRRQGIHGVSQWHLLSKNEKITYLWCIFSSIIHIFVDGSYAIFSRHITPREWFLVIWEKVGKVDQRYADGDSSIIAMESILAIFAGPGCLVFAWAIYTKQANRHIIGLLVCSTQIYTQILYYAITIQEHYDTSILFANPGYFFGFVGFQLLRTVLPIMIFTWCLRKAIKNAEAFEQNKKFFLEAGLERLNLEADLRDQTDDVIDRFFESRHTADETRRIPPLLSQSSLSIEFTNDENSTTCSSSAAGDTFDSGPELSGAELSAPEGGYRVPSPPAPPPLICETPPASHSRRRAPQSPPPRRPHSPTLHSHNRKRSPAPRARQLDQNESSSSFIDDPATLTKLVRMPHVHSDEVSGSPRPDRSFEMTRPTDRHLEKTEIIEKSGRRSMRSKQASASVTSEGSSLGQDPIGMF